MVTSLVWVSKSITYNLGVIQSEAVNVDAQLFEMPLPVSPATDTFELDLFGTLKTINLKGNFVAGFGGLTVKQFVDQFIDDGTNAVSNPTATYNGTGVFSGDQKTLTYTSDSFTNPILVLVKNFNYTFTGGEPTHVEYELGLVESSQVL